MGVGVAVRASAVGIAVAAGAIGVGVTTSRVGMNVRTWATAAAAASVHMLAREVRTVNTISPPLVVGAERHGSGLVMPVVLSHGATQAPFLKTIRGVVLPGINKASTRKLSTSGLAGVGSDAVRLTWKFRKL
ncbi:MAG: hypothetical protein FJ318_07230 [SAR202 cluster bacterium]|nr:hypothetical protein [SAR202 cluster bacterium]